MVGKGAVVEPQGMKSPIRFDRRHQPSRRERRMIATTTKSPLGFDLEPLPPVPTHVRRLMLATTCVVDGFVQDTPEDWHPALEHSMVMPLAGIILVGTRCGRPMMVREVANIAKAVHRDAIIVRASDAPKHATYDVLLHGVAKPCLAYRLWVAPLSGTTWLIPSGGETSYIRLGTFGLEVMHQAPFLDEVECYRGLVHASELLSVAVQGWF